MDTKSLLSVVLGLKDSSWHICDVDLDTEEETVYVTLQYTTPLHFHCKKCGSSEYKHIHDNKSRIWRHKDLCEFMTVLKADVPRVRCAQCGCVSQITIPWAHVFMRITHSFAQQILNGCVVMSLSDVQKSYRISWYTLSKVLNGAVESARKSKDISRVNVLGIDEVAIRKGHVYLTLFYDLGRGEVIWVGENRRSETVHQFVDFFGEQQFKALRFHLERLSQDNSDILKERRTAM